MQTIALSPYIGSHRVPRARRTVGLQDGQRAHLAPPAALSGLSVRVLDMATEQALIQGLRQHAPMDAERDLEPSAGEMESLKDRLGMVMAIQRGDELVATIRFIPCGHGVTLAEKRWAEATRSKEGFGARSWEVGRLIVAPEHRSMALLRACITLAVQALVKASGAQHLHASCSPLLARLYRCFGFVTEKVIQSENGVQHVLIHARVSDVARALGFVPAPYVRPLQLYVNGCALPQKTRYMKTV
ncbi:GNAT family N-acetyltransferase [Hydrogenophaga sp. 2FB]|uniref:GNAT family N-acetyltransferase n=1 Tax=Hydrogenophaga sp. 2FB TaxID=2502187 RepID=UPI0010F67AA6|nr:GNAT family N-acetyltransferase [Hydrogenophaga sp. 2FB]